MPFQHTSAEVAFLLQAFLKKEGNALAHPFGENYQMLDAMVDPDNAGLIKVRISYKKETPEVRTLANNGPTCRFLLSQIPEAQAERPDLPAAVYICEDYLGIYTWGNRYVNDVEPVGEKDLKVGLAHIRVLGYVQNTPVPQLCWAVRQIDEHGKKERVVLSPMRDTHLYTEILVAYLTCTRTVKRRDSLRERRKTSQVYSTTTHLYPFLLPAAVPAYTLYTNLGNVPNGTRVAFLECSCQCCEFHKRTSNAGPGASHAPGGYNWGNLYANCGTYAANEDGKYCWIWETERVRPASIAYAKGPILLSSLPPKIHYETGNFQVGAWVSLWKHGEQYVGMVQSVIEKYQGTVRYGERYDAQTAPCDTLEQAAESAHALWQQIARRS